MNISTHTVIVLIGPSYSGKSTLAKNIQQQITQQLGPNTCAHVSSDAIRERLITGHFYSNTNISKYNAQMLNYSEPAFKILEQEVDGFLSYPRNMPVVIIDTTGLHEDFRKKMQDCAKKHHYKCVGLMFNYDRKEMDAITTDLPHHHREIIFRQLDKLRKTVIGQLKGFDFVARLNSRKQATEFQLTVENATLYRNCQLDPTLRWYVVGDVHACADTLKKLLKKLPGVDVDEKTNELKMDDNIGVVLAGDFVDKGEQLKETIEFIYANFQHSRFKLVRGNHERRVFRDVTRTEIILDEAPKVYKDHVPLLKNDLESQEKFIEIFKTTLPFVQCFPTLANSRGSYSSFIVTHSPCENKYLGKLDNLSQKMQLLYPYWEDPTLETLAKFLHQQSIHGVPYHVFGHVPVMETRVFVNQVPIDTGCVEGGYLTAVCLESRPNFYSVRHVMTKEHTFHHVMTSAAVLPEKLINIPFTKPSTVLLEGTIPQKKKVKSFLKNKINFISGTVSPSGCSKDVLESLEEGLKYFKHKGCQKVVLQPKYMGSRCQFYLFEDWQKCYGVSRNGYKITMNSETLARIVLPLVPKFDWTLLDVVIVDGELLPWSYMGKGLIEDCQRFSVAARAHLNMLQEYGFETAWTQATQQVSLWKTEHKLAEMPKEEAIKTLGNARKYGKYKMVNEIDKWMLPIMIQLKNLDIYDDQIRNYGKSTQQTPVEFKPFEVLKLVYKNGTEKIMPYDPVAAFSLLNPDECCVVDFQNVDYMNKARAFFQKMEQSDMEGVVIKVVDAEKLGIPYMKVRNEKYLTIVYGPNFSIPSIYQVMIQRKNIKNKLKLSETEWNMGRKMLEVPYHNIGKENKNTGEEDIMNTPYAQLLLQFIIEDESANKNIDARL